MKKKTAFIIHLSYLIFLSSPALALTDITVGTDNMTAWASKIHAGFPQTEANALSAGFTLYLTNAAPTCTTNAAAITNWTGSTLAQNTTVNTANGTADITLDGIYRLRLTGNITPDGTNTLQLYADTNAIAQTLETFTGETAVPFVIDWIEPLSTSDQITVQISATETNKSPTLDTLKLIGVKY